MPIGPNSPLGQAAVAIVAVLAVMAWILEYAAGLLGAKKVGASRQALVGAAIVVASGLFVFAGEARALRAPAAAA